MVFCYTIIATTAVGCCRKGFCEITAFGVVSVFITSDDGTQALRLLLLNLFIGISFL